MLSWLELSINRYCCIYSVVYIISITTKLGVADFMWNKHANQQGQSNNHNHNNQHNNFALKELLNFLMPISFFT
jgi:hypothetical protein